MEQVKRSCAEVDDKFYDTFWFAYDEWSDETEANDLKKDLIDWDMDKLKKGSRFSITEHIFFSVIYAFCGITFLLVATSYLCLAVGAYVMYTRMAGLCCSCCLGCINFAALITAAVFRFNSAGKFAALSKAPSKWEGTDSVALISDDRTYSDDANVILALWIVQLTACVCSCCVNMFFNQPKIVIQSQN
uniref:Uncharacterized protein n=1 Tax=Favella ehrenbergii TaxID=182087 RepID=A0A7S3I508_9SPIT|mmetsp:Transcript_36609/g.44723  ORF Transcript_36609/g.44723 Transcript_36609/m.44723 type:complete len:189 (+) Transcript_36609:217-783(+)